MSLLWRVPVFFVLPALWLPSAADPIKTIGGVAVQLNDATVELAVANDMSFRLGISSRGVNGPIKSPMVLEDFKSYAPHQVTSPSPTQVGVKTSFGEMLVDFTEGSFLLKNSDGEVILRSSQLVQVIEGDLLIALGRDLTNKRVPVFYGSGETITDDLETRGGNAQVVNRHFVVPHYFTTDGYSALCVGTVDYDPLEHNAYPVAWQRLGLGSAMWTVSGTKADLYLTPATSFKDSQKALWKLTGAPAVPPLYAFGFIASMWGWKDRAYIETTLETFRAGRFPVDAFVADFEWYTIKPDYVVPDEGVANFTDFGYNPKLFPDPINQLKTYHEVYNVRFGGIRKPRLGNKDFVAHAAKMGWNISAAKGDGGKRNLNYSMPEVRKWYQDHMAHYYHDGVDFFWNDEGESTYFTNYWWVKSEVDLAAKLNITKRQWSINRDFTLGMQRYGAVTWTGDQFQTWQALQKQPTYLLSWQQAGLGYVACDTGGFSRGFETPELLVRWYQLSTFLSMMRVHSSIEERPHFPWLWGIDAERAMLKAVRLRYRMITILYSLAHRQYDAFEPMFRPLAYYFPNDPFSFEASAQWFVGEHLMVAPMLQSFPPWRSVYFPEGTWYHFDSQVPAFEGGTAQLLENIPLDVIPIYVRAGGVIVMAPPDLQHTGEIPNGALEVQVYAGTDGNFTLTEDDGETYAYQTGNVRHTTFEWHDATGMLTWSASGPYNGKRFLAMRAIIFHLDGSSEESGVHILGESGSLRFHHSPMQLQSAASSKAAATSADGRVATWVAVGVLVGACLATATLLLKPHGISLYVHRFASKGPANEAHRSKQPLLEGPTA